MAGLPPNISNLQAAAERGDAVAANNLGVLYANGTNIPQDFAQARKWYEFASAHGNPAGEANLGYAYQNGQGTPVDIPEAIKWYRLAVSHNYPPAKLLLGMLYRAGSGVSRDDEEGVRLIHAAAVDGFPLAQALTALLYIEGSGVPADDGLAYEWASLASAKLTGVPGTIAQRARQDSAKGLSPADLAVAQAATAQWRPGMDLVSPFPANSGPRPPRLRGQGSGFVIGKGGEIVTDYHVVPNCREVRLKDPAGKFNAVTHIVAEDRANDLAVLGGGGFGVRLRISSEPPALGEAIVTYGFPLGPMLSSAGNLTTGAVSSLAGMQGNSKTFQITAPVQQGSSGGPVVDEGGAAIGIVTSKLNAVAIAATTGDIAQNVNFAARMEPLKALLDQHSIAYETGGKAHPRTMTELADELQKATVKIECWR